MPMQPLVCRLPPRLRHRLTTISKLSRAFNRLRLSISRLPLPASPSSTVTRPKSPISRFPLRHIRSGSQHILNTRPVTRRFPALSAPRAPTDLRYCQPFRPLRVSFIGSIGTRPGYPERLQAGSRLLRTRRPTDAERSARLRTFPNACETVLTGFKCTYRLSL
jgi:hypothetical protein